MQTEVLVLLHRDENVYLGPLKRGPFAGLLNGSGGKIREPESLRGGCVRETFEEMGVFITTKTLVETAVIDDYRPMPCSCPTDATSEEERLYFEHKIARRVFVYTTSEWAGEFEETEEMGVAMPFPIDALPFELMHPGDEFWMPHALQKREGAPKGLPHFTVERGYGGDRSLWITRHINTFNELMAPP